ncbi:hypothetical protein [Vallitalea okinawensis]|uniref:hypothetical protein n=1 Tax=Vallitalea okinawensis TaxID=2078660 RepID=UPI000CFAB537|nr:hypothetical protein [Vallitalea okinawensis]
MSIKFRDSTSFDDIKNGRYWNGSAWVELKNAWVWSGSEWVECFKNSLITPDNSGIVRIFSFPSGMETRGSTNSGDWYLSREIEATESGLFVVRATTWCWASSGISKSNASFGLNGILVGPVTKSNAISAEPWDAHYLEDFNQVVSKGDKIQLWLRVDPSYYNGTTAYALGQMKKVTNWYKDTYVTETPYPFTRTKN